MTSYIISPPSLEPAFLLPRFTGRAIRLGPYASAAEWERHFVHTVGFGDPTVGGDELRFDRKDGRLQSLNLPLSSRSPLDVYPEGLEIVQADTCTIRDIAPGRTWKLCMSAELGLLSIRTFAEAVTGVQVAEHLSLFVDAQGNFCGWQLAHPEALLASGYQPCLEPVTDEALAHKLVAYLLMAHDEDFIDSLVDDDEAARERVRALASEISAIGRDTTQTQVLLGLVNELLEV